MNKTVAAVARFTSAIAGQGPSAAKISSTSATAAATLSPSEMAAGTVFQNSKELMVPRLTSEIISDEDDEDRASRSDDEDDDDNESCGTVSDFSTEEIPVWIRGEQRFISGVTDDTTCGDLIQALLQQENLAAGSGAVETKDYCITERWRQVEQILDSKTKIWQIWSAWGKAQPEVKFILRRMDSPHELTETSASGGISAGTIGLSTERDKDSGRGSPTGSINSAIVRRKRHRAHKSSFAWMTHGTTIHPKSSKNSIERLMKLILEQGDIIQQQLSKLRDRELQISKIEEERHRVREREHGKNYLLETYLRGLPEVSELDPSAGDSGVTSEATTAASPEVESCHDRDIESPASSSSAAEKDVSLKEKIKMMESIVLLNKQIVREEEAAVKLFDRIRRYQLDIPNQTQAQVEENLTKINTSIDKSQSELQMIDETLKHSDIVLREKTCLLKCLQDELDEQELQSNVIMDFSKPNPVLSVGRVGPMIDAVAPIVDHTPPIHNSYPLYTISEHQSRPEVAQNTNTLLRNQRFSVVPPNAIPPQISVHQINKFIHSTSKLGNNCNATLDDKTCPKQLFNSAMFSESQHHGRDGFAEPLGDDFSSVGTLV
ncbi:ras association domain-containing protein 10-like [Toxorhynchites rutilus septentrionalis]|uniref:ras association domain-containing protein 10-like n=1 Tax=Toxorhynchites rutilus septentrionalis TaxID=329112 RepID=UPI002479074D|nr:ras association domain-containing protein 10-like [Toxorhynchites rutilus septentrionalis]